MDVGWKWMMFIGWGLIAWRVIAFMVPGLPKIELGATADFLAPWIAIGIGMLLKGRDDCDDK